MCTVRCFVTNDILLGFLPPSAFSVSICAEHLWGSSIGNRRNPPTWCWQRDQVAGSSTIKGCTRQDSNDSALMGFMVPREPLGCLDRLEKREAVELLVVQVLSDLRARVVMMT